MMDAVHSHLSEIETGDWFVLVRVQVSEGGVEMAIENSVR